MDKGFAFLSSFILRFCDSCCHKNRRVLGVLGTVEGREDYLTILDGKEVAEGCTLFDYVFFPHVIMCIVYLYKSLGREW